jgi:glutaminyl-peptide cyclotransferase
MTLRALAMPLVRVLREARRHFDQGPSTWETVAAGPFADEGPAEFDGARAFDLLRAQCEIGPRVAGTESHARTVEWLIEQLRPHVDALVLQRWNQKVSRGPGAGRTFRMVNLLARIRGTDGAAPDADAGTMLSAHWDTKPVADQDPDPSRRHLPVPGANDGASGVAVLLELARALHARRPARDVVLAFWDGEDMGEYYYGSRAYARALARRKAPMRAECGIVLDMVGKRGLRCNTEANSLRQAPQLWADVHACAAELGLAAHFGGPPRTISDDHVFLSRAGIPSIVLIDYAYPPWHTTADTVEQCDPLSLQVVGDVMLRFVRGMAG